MNAKTLKLLAAAIGACCISNAAAGDRIDDQLARSQAAIINALVAGASVHAPAQLSQARATLDAAKRFRIPGLATQAEADAKAAEAVARKAGETVRTATHTPSRGG